MNSRDAEWRWFPWAMIGGIVAVMVVNGGMIYAALHTHPGAAGTDGFDLSNRYDAVLERSAQQRKLGWRVVSRAEAGHPVLRLEGVSGDAPQVVVQAVRPVGPQDAIALTLDTQEDGRLVAREVLPAGQWLLEVRLSRGDDVVTSTERLIVR